MSPGSASNQWIYRWAGKRTPLKLQSGIAQLVVISPPR
jgi:hypothetical protein